jgi:ferredoxin-NADP reductase
VNDPHIWWYISRISAMVAWGLMSFSVVWGVLLASRVFRGLDNPSWLKDIHKYLSTLTVILAGVHTSALTLDPFVKFDIADILIPGVATYEGATPLIELALAVGVVAFWIMTVVYATSLFMDKLPRWFWKGIHYSAYLVFFAIGIHAAYSGSDVGTWWYGAVSIWVITMGMLALIIRFAVVALKDKRASRDAVIAETKRAAELAKADALLISASEDSREKRSMVVQSVTAAATDVVGIRLIPVGGGRVAWWDAGSHITLHLADGRERQYSLCGDPTDRSGYDISGLDTHGQDAASTWIHRNIRVGSIITVSGPRNHFPMVPSQEYLFVAGGIGITPIRAMIESVPTGRKWKLVYLGKERAAMAYVDELLQKYPKNVSVHESAKDGRLNITSLLNKSTADVFCCGPEALMNEVEESLPATRSHLERFSPVAREIEGGAKPMVVRVASTGRTVSVGADESVLDALTKAGVAVDSSCGRGVCGSCELRVIDGVPAHLDSVMPDELKDEMQVFYPCVSRSQTSEITVDA